MRASTHRAITAAVARALGVGGRALEAMLKGSVDPDIYPEEEVKARVGRGGRVYFVRRRVRHHTAHNKPRIMRLIWRSRKMLLKGRLNEAAYLLGYALHYVQDAYIPSWNHAGLESTLKTIPIPIPEIRGAIMEALCSPSYVEGELKRIRPMSGEAALIEAARTSASIAAAVLGPTDPPQRLLEEERAERGKHLFRMLLAILSAALTIPSLLAPSPATLILPISALIFYIADGKYRRIKKELKWFRKPKKKSA